MTPESSAVPFPLPLLVHRINGSAAVLAQNGPGPMMVGAALSATETDPYRLEGSRSNGADHVHQSRIAFVPLFSNQLANTAVARSEQGFDNL
jgi:hypothetical protein